MTLPEVDFHTTSHDRWTQDPVGLWYLGNHPDCPADALLSLNKVLLQHQYVAAYNIKDMPGYTGDAGPFRINNTTTPPYVRQRRHSPRDQAFAKSKVQEMLDAGIIRLSNSTRYACEWTAAAKKDTQGDWTDLRFCNDFRAMNECTPLDRYPLPHPEDIFNELGEARYFSKLDLRAGFNQIPMAAEDVEKTSFWYDGSKYEYVRMPFGLKNAPIHFQRIMDQELSKHALRDFCRCFIDDLIVYSRTPEEHVEHVARVLAMLDDCNLRFHPTKSVFMTESVEYLGHFVGPYGLSPAAAKVKAIHDMPTPKSVEDVRSVMGLFQYYMRYVPNYSAIARPITDLTKKNQPWNWSPQCEAAFCKLKSELCAPGRALRCPDFNKPFVLHTDFSNVGIAAVLTQQDDDGHEYMIAAISRSLSVHERIYSPYQGELLAAVWAIRAFHLYLHGVPFTLFTDHQPLQWLFSRSDLTGQSARWVLLLQEYEFTTVHRPGVDNGNADALSRMPLPCEDQAVMHPPLAAVLPSTATLDSVSDMLGRVLPGAAPYLPAPNYDLPSYLTPKSQCPAALSFHTQASQEGVVIVDLCGGIATSLDCALRLGYSIKGYAYADLDPEARWVAHHRIQQLLAAYPGQVPPDLTSTFLSHLPQNVHDIRPKHLLNLSSAFPTTPLLFVCGWPCQDLSPAGPNIGLDGERSSLIHTVLPILARLIAIHPASVGYILENAATQHNFHSAQVRVEATAELVRMLGPYVTVDAVQCGSYAHRLRNFWTNLAAPSQLSYVIAALRPRPGHYVQNLLEPGHTVQLAQYTDRFPFFPINVEGEPVRVMPTLVSYAHSHSFRDGRQGMLRTQSGHLQQPSVVERERILGLPTNATAAPGTSDKIRHDLTGRVIDCHCFVTLLYTSSLLVTGQPVVPFSASGDSTPVPAWAAAPVLRPVTPELSSYPLLVTDLPAPFVPGTVLPDKPALPTPPPYSLRPVSFQLLPTPDTQLGGIGDTERTESGGHSGHTFIRPLLPRDSPTPVIEMGDEDPAMASKGDIWEDLPTLAYLQSSALPTNVSSAESARIKRRAGGYHWKAGKLFRSLSDRESREVPPPAARWKLAVETHQAPASRALGSQADSRAAGN